jgi:hypothetical protein
VQKIASGRRSRWVWNASLALGLGLVLVGVGAMAAEATSSSTTSTIFQQEKSEWCWAAASETVIKHDGGGTDSQCQIVEWGFNTSTCPNKPGTQANVSATLTRAGLGSIGTIDGAAISYNDVKNEIIDQRQFMIRWQWSTGEGHMLVGVGYNTSGSEMTYINPEYTSYQVEPYSWVKSGNADDGNGAHVWDETRWQIIHH